MAVERLLDEIAKLGPEEKKELFPRLGIGTDRNGAPALERVGFGMWADRKMPESSQWARQLREEEWNR